jgi:hypothetical protein
MISTMTSAKSIRGARRDHVRDLLAAVASGRAVKNHEKRCAPERNRAIVARYVELQSTRHVAAEFHLGRERVRQICEAAGVLRPSGSGGQR